MTAVYTTLTTRNKNQLIFCEKILSDSYVHNTNNVTRNENQLVFYIYYFFVMQARYTDPQTKIRYANPEEFTRVRTLPSDLVTGYLALRKASAPVP